MDHASTKAEPSDGRQGQPICYTFESSWPTESVLAITGPQLHAIFGYFLVRCGVGQLRFPRFLRLFCFIQGLPPLASSTIAPVVNLATYKFCSLDDLRTLRKRLQAATQKLGIRGTILLAHEGINLFVSGRGESIDALQALLESIEAIGVLDCKRSPSDRHPYRRMLVKIKKEIIPLGVTEIRPAEHTSTRISAEELREWIEAGKEFELLDCRNDYEVELGTFAGARAIGTDTFRQFPAAAAELPSEMKQRPVVTFCTGGIRCEKAGPYLERLGFQEVYQLDGGILRYFETCDGAHFDGDCFVFDHRVAINAELDETEVTQCYACQAALSAEDQASPEYDPPHSCPHCFESEAAAMAERIESRQARLTRQTDPLPGSIPYTNQRFLHVPPKADGMQLLDYLDASFPFLSREAWHQRIVDQLVLREGTPLTPETILSASDRLENQFPNTTEPDVSVDIRILYEDDWIVVVHKPAPLPMHPCGRFNKNTLGKILDGVYHPRRLRIAHRLDANTSGVVVFTRSQKVARTLQPEFEKGGIEKTYLARAWGHPPEDTFVCTAPISGHCVQAGARVISENGLSAETRFQVLRRLDDGTCLLEVQPITGRTNQIRVHLWHQGWPICGDPTYLPDGSLGKAQTLLPSDPPLCLHAHAIAFRHPVQRGRVRYTADPPAWVVDTGWSPRDT